MLFSDESRRYFFAVRITDRDAEDALRHENTLRMVTKRAVAKRGVEALGFVEPRVDGKIIFDLPTVLFDGRFGVVKWMHGEPLKVESPWNRRSHHRKTHSQC